MSRTSFRRENAYPLQGEALQRFEAPPTFLGQEVHIPPHPHPTAPLLIFLEQTNNPILPARNSLWSRAWNQELSS